MFRTEDKGLIVRTKLFLSFISAEPRRDEKKLKYLAVNALSARLKILLKQLLAKIWAF